MTFPAGVTLCEVSLPASSVWQGGASTIQLTLTPTRSLVHRTSGQTLTAITGSSTGPTGPGVVLLVPHSQQSGYRDAAGNSIGSWDYEMLAVYRDAAGASQTVRKQIKIPSGATSINALAATDYEVPLQSVGSQESPFPSRLTEAALNATYAGKNVETAKLENTRDASDTFQSLTRRITVPDIAGSKGSVLNIDHRGDGTGNTANPGQTYGIDLHNYPGAVSAMVGHQYSANGPFLWLDNTDNQPLIRLHNTQNTTLNPGRDGTGDFLQFQDHGTEIMRFTKDLVFSTLNGTKTLTVLNTVAKAFSVQQASSYAGSGHAMEIIKSATGTGSALDVTNAGTGKGVYIRQNGAATGLQIDAGAAAAGLYPLVVTGQDYGPNVTTANNGGTTLNLTKNGTGAGDVLKVTNKGTGNALSIHNTAGTRTARIGPNGSFITANTTAPVLADLADGETAIWRDATTGDLKVTSRTSGAIKTATLAVA